MNGNIFDRYRVVAVGSIGIIAMIVVPFLPFQVFPSDAESVKDIAGPGVIFELLALNRDLATPTKPKWFSATDIVSSPDGKYLYIAGQTAKVVKIFDLRDKTVCATISLPDEVTGLSVAPDGTMLYATCSSDRWPSGKVCAINLPARKVTATIAVGNGARAPVITPDGEKLFVCNRYDNDVSVINLMMQSVSTRIPAGREPYCAAITPDGKTVIVGNLLSSDLATDTNSIASVISFIDVDREQADGTLRLTRGEYSIHGLTVSPDGKYAFATHFYSSGFNILGSTVTGGWGGKNNLMVIDLALKTVINSVSLDWANKGMGSPWDVECSDDGAFLVVAHAGIDELTIIDLPEFINVVIAQTNDGINLRSKFNVINEIRVNRTVSSVGIRALKLIDGMIYTTGYFNETPYIEQLPLSLKTTPVATTYPLDERVPLTTERKGETFFYTSKICFQYWRSCHTCHSFTGTSVLNQMLNSGVTSFPKNTKSLVYSWWTPPLEWGSRRDDGHAKVIASIMLQLFVTPVDSVAYALDTFLMSIQPVPSPFLEKGQLSLSAQRGKGLFYSDKTGCSTCHIPPLFCDGKSYQVPIGDPHWTDPANTPSLVNCWKSAPYSHLGNIGSIREMITLPDHQPKTALTPQELIDLEQYILSL